MLKPRYKQTDLGVLPEEWEVKPLGQLAHIKTGKKNNEDKVEGGLYPFFVRSPYVERINSYSFDGEAILLPGEGNIGSIFHYINGKFDYHQRVYKVSNFTPEVVGRYVYYCMVQNFGAHAATNTVKATVDSLRLPTFQEFTIPLPPPAEQQAIAEALGAIDNLLTSQQQLLAKKRALKLATQQALLSGERRLPGFAGKWEEKAIAEISPRIVAGGTPSTTNSAYWGGSIKWMSSGELNFKLVRNVTGRITEEGFNNSSAQTLPPLCVLIGLAGQGKTRGTAAVNLVELCTNQSIAAIFPSQSHDSFFLFYNLDSRYEELRELSSGDSGRGGLNLSIIGGMTIDLPPLDEQRAIAGVLSDMDAEMEALAAQVAKTQALKQGMMQDLLTGTIRLRAGAAAPSSSPTV